MLKSIDILIGVSVVMLLVSMAVTLLTHIVTTLSNSRGRHLMRGLADILQQIDPALTKEITMKISTTVLTHPLVSDVSKRLGTVIHREEFTKILMDLAANNGPQTLGDDARQVLLRAMQNQGIANPAATLDNIRALALTLEKTNPELANDVRLSLAIMHEAPSQFVAKIHGWFDQTIDRVSARFTASTRVITCVTALIVAFAIQLDSFALINRLAADPELRKTLLTQAQGLEKNPPASVTSPQQGPAGNPPAASQSQQQDDNAKSVERIMQITDGALASRGLISWPTKWTWKHFYWILWYPVFEDYSLHKLLGILLTGALLSLGAPFWYDTLKTALRLRSAIADKDDDQREVRQTTQQPDQQTAPPQPSTAPVAAGVLAGERGDLKAVG
jgi:hypothetical protein